MSTRQLLSADDFERFMLGNEFATSLCLSLYHVMHVWDDLIDKDKPLQDEAINQAFFYVMGEMPVNPFFRTHVDALSATLRTVMLSWIASTDLERGEDETGRDLAFGVRTSFVDFVMQCACLLGGYRHSQQVARECYAALCVVESLSEYKKELGNA